MRPRTRIVLLSATTALVLAFALAVLLDRPSGRSPAASSSSAGVVPGVAASSTASTEADAPSASGFYGAALPAGVRAHNFTLIDQSGRAVSLSHYRGQVVVLAFLYSTCGPTCIVIAQQIRGALDELSGAGGHPVAVLFISADPSADTPTHVHNFLAQVSLTGRIHYLTGPLSQLRIVWSAYGIVPASSSHADFSDSASVLLIDPHGYERVLFSVEQLTPESLTHDIKRLQGG